MQEVEKRKRVEDAYKHMSRERSKPVHVFGGPDYEVSGHCMFLHISFWMQSPERFCSLLKNKSLGKKQSTAQNSCGDQICEEETEGERKRHRLIDQEQIKDQIFLLGENLKHVNNPRADHSQ